MYIRFVAVAAGTASAGTLLREWRRRRKLSQFEVATRSAVSARHLSFIETGRARPSREMILHLAQRLEIPLRERNHLLLAGGFAPVFTERSLDEAEMGPVRDALKRLLSAHEPFPALVVDRHWNIVEANRGVGILTRGVAPELLEPPVNALRVALHPDGMAPRIANLAEWRRLLLERLRREIEATGDPELQILREELSAYGEDLESDGDRRSDRIALMYELRLDDEELVFFSTVTTFGTARDVTVAELSIEAFFPASNRTAAALAAQAHREDGGSRPPRQRL